jgi:hypothetical protein
LGHDRFHFLLYKLGIQDLHAPPWVGILKVLVEYLLPYIVEYLLLFYQYL